MKQKKKGLALGLALMLGLMADCGKSGEAPSKTGGKEEAAEAKEQITVSVHPSGHGLPAYVAEQKGYYEEKGLEVETLVYIGAPPQMEAYEAGAWDIGTTGFGGIVLGVVKSSLKIIGVTIDDGTVMGLWARPDSAIAKTGYQEDTGCYGTAEEWKGLENLYTQGTITDIMLTSTLERLGLVPEDVVRTNMDSSPAFTAFQAGSGDLVRAYMKRVLIGLALACLTGIPLGLLMGWSKTD